MYQNASSPAEKQVSCAADLTLQLKSYRNDWHSRHGIVEGAAGAGTPARRSASPLRGSFRRTGSEREREREREKEGDVRNETEYEETEEKVMVVEEEEEEEEEGRKRGRGNWRGEETGWKRAREQQRKGVIKRRKGGRQARGTGEKESGEMP
ncbi:hypothetical protein G5I_01963 [Acromyrmex echinatior]|uniref:Uncharacterized protein n=1 Tax=Acromyrmex echinatior TaxID=103372 RepID=F4W917_ACREC|nr:hypothetical protein G5I_01963 [Acromyrmex echinatior]